VRRLDFLRKRLTVAESATEVGGTVEYGAPKTHQQRTVPILLGAQLRPAAGAGARLVHDHLVGLLDLPQVRPSRPGWPPGLRPDRPRSDVGAGLSSPSRDGGWKELREEAASCRSSSAIRASSSAIRASCSTIRASCLPSRACSWAMIRSCAATSAASCS